MYKLQVVIFLKVKLLLNGQVFCWDKFFFFGWDIFWGWCFDIKNFIG